MKKVCTKCGEGKELGEFGRDKRAKDGCKSQCLACQRIESAAYAKRPEVKKANAENQARYRKRHPERVKAAQRRDWAENSEKRKAGQRRWREENPDKARAAVRRWKEANPDHKLRLQQEYAERHPDRILANARRQEHRRRSGGDDPTPETREYAAVLQGDPCCYCGKPMEHIDHIDSRELWGSDLTGWTQWENLTAACQRCNNRKYTQSLLGFLLKKGKVGVEPTLPLAA